MPDLVFNIAKGSTVEKFRDGAANGIVLLMEAVENDAVISDYDSLDQVLGAAGNVEVTGGGYSRATSVTGFVVVDDVNDRAEVSFPDQIFSNVVGSAIVAVIVAYEEGPSDAQRIPLTKHDFFVTPDGSDVVVRFT